MKIDSPQDVHIHILIQKLTCRHPENQCVNQENI